jgi:predicted metal-dependent phosphoesterase TrpH
MNRDKELKIFASCHNHSYFSDGDYSPEKMVKLAYMMGHGGFILTDHDTVKGSYFANKEARKWGLKSIVGCEFSTFYKGVGVHLLGFDFNPDNKRMREHLDLGSSTQTDRSKLLFEWGLERGTLREGITWDDVLEAYPYNDYICNNQIFEVMKAKKIYDHSEYNDFFNNNFSQSLGYEEEIGRITGKSFRNFKTIT